MQLRGFFVATKLSTSRVFRSQQRCISGNTTIKKCKYGAPSLKPSLLMQDAHVDGTRWDEFTISDNDIFINTPFKAGTTWMQEIVAQLLYNGNIQSVLNVNSVHNISKWYTLHAVPREFMVNLYEEQLSNPNIKRRIIKTHEPPEAIPFNEKSKHIFLGRDYRDMICSLYHFMSNYTDLFYDTLNEKAKEFKTNEIPKYNYHDGSYTLTDLWNNLLHKPDDYGNNNGYPVYSQLWVAGSWWNVKHLSNVKLIHYSQLKNNLAETMRDIALFLDIEIDENNFDNLVENSTFKSMKARKISPIPDDFFVDQDKFLNKGTIGQWVNVLNEKDIENYREVAKQYLDDDGIYWLENGGNY